MFHSDTEHMKKLTENDRKCIDLILYICIRNRVRESAR